MSAGATVVDHTTASADVARELYAAAKALGVAFIDAPVSGGQAGAQNGALTVMCGGDPAAFDAVRPVGMAFSKAFTRMGESGAGQLTKMVNQVCIAGLVQGLSEAIAFGQKAGLDMHLALDVIDHHLGADPLENVVAVVSGAHLAPGPSRCVASQ